MFKGIRAGCAGISCFFILLLSFVTSLHAGSAGNSSGLLFQIARPGQDPSYLFGTMHSDDKRVLELAEPVLEKIHRVRRVVLEIDLNPGSMLASMSAMILSDGRNLQQILGDSLYEETRMAVEGIGIPEVALRGFKPWAVATLLSLPSTGSGKFLDMALYQEAAAAGFEVIGLESVEEQLAIFDGMPERDQVAILKDTLAHLDQIPAMMTQLMEAYLARDLKKLVDLSNRFQAGGDPGIAGRFQQAAVTDRNLRMSQRLLPLLEEGPAVIAVGALHLPGEQGLLNLLEQQGFQVEKVF